MMIDEMGIKLIDEADIGEYVRSSRSATAKSRQAGKKDAAGRAEQSSRTMDGEEIDLNLEAELAEASTKRIDDPVRMYLTQMGEIPLLTREQEIAPRQEDRDHPQDLPLARCSRPTTASRRAVEILQQVDDGDLPFDRTMKICTAEDQADKGTIGQRIPLNLGIGPQDARAQPRRLGRAARSARTRRSRTSCSWRSAAAAAAASSCSKSCRCAPARSRR